MAREPPRRSALALAARMCQARGVPSKIPLPSDDELEPEHRELLARVPPRGPGREPRRRGQPDLSRRFLESTRVEIEPEQLLGGQTLGSAASWPGER
jgi:hypothetical protein